MLSEKEKLLRSGKKNWIGFLIAFFILGGTQFLEGKTSHYVTLIIYIAAAYTIFFLLRSFHLGRQFKKHPGLDLALNDEYIQHIRLKSYRVAYWAINVVIISLLFFKDVFALSDDSTILIILMTAIFSPAIFFLIPERWK